MHTAGIITLCFASTLAAGFLLAGFCALLAHDDADERRFNEKLAKAKRKGPWQEYLTMRREALRFSQVVSHWRSRPEVRLSIWLGLVSGVIAVGASLFI